VGVSLGMNTEFLLDSFLTFHGLRLRDVQIVDSAFRPGGCPGGGETDAACLYPPFSYEVKARLGGAYTSWSTQGGQEYFYLLTTTADCSRNGPGQ